MMAGFTGNSKYDKWMAEHATLGDCTNLIDGQDCLERGADTYCPSCLEWAKLQIQYANLESG